MKNLRILAAATLFALTSIAMLAGCGDTNDNPGAHPDDGKVCKGHKDCSDGTICVEWVPDDPAKPKGAGKGKCRVDCAKNGQKDQATCDSKAKGKTCIAHDAKWACSPKAGGPGQQGPECSATKACKDTTKVCDVAAGKCIAKCTTPEGKCQKVIESCNETSGLCEDVLLHSVAIVDVSTGDDACGAKSADDKGSDIVAVEVASSDDTPIAYGVLYGAQNGNGTDPNTQATAGTYHDNSSLGDGYAPDPNEKNCIIDGLGKNAGKHKFISLGCGGILTVTTGSKSFKKGDLVKVYEYDGKQCAADTSAAPVNADKYKVYVCPSQAQDVTDYETNCALISGETPLSGYTSTPVE